MTIQELINKEPKVLTNRKSSHRPILLTSRIRLARNIEGFRFPGWAGPSERLEIYESCKEAIEKCEAFSPSIHFSIEALDKMERQFLVERHLVSRELTESQSGAGVTINNTQDMAIMINEEDHLRIQIMSAELSFDELWELSDNLDSELEKRLDYAYREQWGYLTACPTNLGTGMRASAMMHLPALVMTKQMDKVIRAVNQLGIVARGIFGESSESSGSVFQISNQQTLGETEQEIIQRLSNVINTIIDQENNARVRLFEQEGNMVIDRIYRAYGVLKYCNMLSSSEAMSLLSNLRFASDIGMLNADVRPMVDQMVMDIQPSHLQFGVGEMLDSDRRDVLRAEKLRALLSQLEEPQPSNIDFSTNKMQPTDPDSGISNDRTTGEGLA